MASTVTPLPTGTEPARLPRPRGPTDPPPLCRHGQRDVIVVRATFAVIKARQLS
jgi:hypothetical protein